MIINLPKSMGMKRNHKAQISLARLMGLVAIAGLLCFGLRAAERNNFVEVCNFCLILFIVDATLFSYSQQLRPFLAGTILAVSGYLLLVVNFEKLRPHTLLERPDLAAILFAAHALGTVTVGFAGGLIVHLIFHGRRQPQSAKHNSLPRNPR